MATAAPTDIQTIIKEWRRLSTRVKLAIVEGTNYFYNVTYGLDACDSLFRHIESNLDSLVGWMREYYQANRSNIWLRQGLEAGWNSIHEGDDLPAGFDDRWPAGSQILEDYRLASRAMTNYRRQLLAEPTPDILAIHAGRECEEVAGNCWHCDEMSYMWRRRLEAALYQETPGNIFLDYWLLNQIRAKGIPEEDLPADAVAAEPEYEPADTATLDSYRAVYDASGGGKTLVQRFIPLAENVTSSTRGASIFGIDIRGIPVELAEYDIYNLLCKKLSAVLYTIGKDQAYCQALRATI